MIMILILMMMMVGRRLIMVMFMPTVLMTLMTLLRDESFL